MIDFGLLSLLLMFGFVALVVIFKVFKWGHNQEFRIDLEEEDINPYKKKS